MTEATIEQGAVILFDGVCNLCNASIVFILQYERKPIFQFASIQSQAGQKQLECCQLPADYLQSVILIENGKVSLGSTAALKIGRTLKLPWSLFAYAATLVPKFIRD